MPTCPGLAEIGLLAGTFGLKMCPKSFHLAWRAIVGIGSECVCVCIVPCWRCVRVKDPRKKAQLFAVKDVPTSKFTCSKAPCMWPCSTSGHGGHNKLPEIQWCQLEFCGLRM